MKAYLKWVKLTKNVGEKMLKEFFVLEGAYLVIAIVILLVTLYVTTRPFMPKGAKKKGLIYVLVILASFIAGHYYITTSRIDAVKEAFQSGKAILCESRMLRKAAQVIEIQKNTPAKWSIDGYNFISPNYIRPFNIARCIVKQ